MVVGNKWIDKVTSNVVYKLSFNKLSDRHRYSRVFFHTLKDLYIFCRIYIIIITNRMKVFKWDYSIHCHQ